MNDLENIDLNDNIDSAAIIKHLIMEHSKTEQHKANVQKEIAELENKVKLKALDVRKRETNIAAVLFIIVLILVVVLSAFNKLNNSLALVIGAALTAAGSKAFRSLKEK